LVKLKRLSLKHWTTGLTINFALGYPPMLTFFVTVA
jgi:hypothetical protein